MERLTAKDTVAGVEYNDLKIGISEMKAIDLLGQYEDTGLTPDEISILKEENAKLKQQLDEAMELLKLATKDIEFLGDHFGCAGCDELRPDWSDHIGDWHDCPFASDKKDECREDWKYQDRYEKLKGEVQNERD